MQNRKVQPPRAITAGTSKKNKKNSKKRRTQVQLVTPMRAPTLHLSQCALDYLKSLADPFDTSLVPCIPDSNSTPSFKTAAWARGTFNTSAASGAFGAVAFNPWEFQVQTATTGKVSFPITFTDGSEYFTSTAAIIDTTFPAGPHAGISSQNLNHNMPAIAPDQSSYRVVSAGLKVRCISPTLYEGGQLAKIKRLGPSQIYDLQSNDVLNSPVAEMDTPKQNKWHRINYVPDMSYMYDYQNTLGPKGFFNDYGYTSTNTPSATTLAFVAAAPSGTGASLSFEWYARVTYECIGGSVPSSTASHSDLMGFSAIRSAFDQRNYTKMETSADAGFSSILKSVYDSASTLSYIAVPAVTTVMANMANERRMEQNWRNQGLVI